MSVSLMTFFNYIPYIIVSLFAGAFVDKHNKKTIMLVSDSIAAVCSGIIFVLCISNELQICHIYMVNFMIGFVNAFQGPASAIVIGKMVPRDKLSQASGLSAFSNNLITVLAPVLASALFSYGGLRFLILIDLLSFVGAFLTLIFIIKFPEECGGVEEQSMVAGCLQGIYFLKRNRGIWGIIITMALINFFSRLTYENILSPMILARSGNDSVILGMVNAAMGIAGIAGGVLVAFGKLSRDSVKMIYISAIFSFLLGDLMMGVGRNVIVWSFAGVAASLPIPFIIAGQNVILYKSVPEEIQGRVFAVRNAIQFSTIPVGILLGGFLADYVFEPFMLTDNVISAALHCLVGSGKGSGMAVMFLCTGILGSIFSLISYNLKDIQRLSKNETL